MRHDVAGRPVAEFLFGAPPTDPVVLGAAAAGFGLVAAAASWIPAARAARLDPMRALRSE